MQVKNPKRASSFITEKMLTSTSSAAAPRAAYRNPISISPHSPPSTFSLSFTSAPLRNSHYRFLRVKALDAAQPFDYESKLSYQSTSKLKIAIIGFGNYGQFLAKTLTRQGHSLLAHSRSDYTDVAAELGVSFFSDPHDVCEQHPDVVILCTSIISSENVLNSLPLHRFKRNTLFVDVMSVKEFPKSLLLRTLPPYFDIICTHPMFGPQSAKDGWSGLSFVYEKVRIHNEKSRISRCEKFLDIFEREGCRMVEMSCAEHDLHAVWAQFLTHTVGRILCSLDLKSTQIDTKGYESLLDLVENTSGDSFDLYYGLFLYNTNAMEQLERLDLGFEALRKQLFGHVHGILRKQLFGSSDNDPAQRKVHLLPEHATAPGGSENGHALAKATNLVRPEDIFFVTSYKTLFSSILDESEKLKIAIVGFGNFGQFIAKTMIRQGHHILAYSRSNYMDVAQQMGATFYNDADDLCEEHPDVVLLCTSILSTEKVLNSLPLQRLKRSTLFVDVLSVKEFPRNFLIQNLPADFDILCTHPMFGPESGKNGWKGLAFVYDKVRIGTDESRVSRCDRFLDIFAREGCRMVEMSCVDHDRNAAGTQFITHTVGRILEKLHPKSTPINTKGYDTLLNLVSNTAGDSFDLYYGLFMYNKNAMEQLERMDLAFESLKKELFGQLHGVVRKQLFDDVGHTQMSQETYMISDSNR